MASHGATVLRHHFENEDQQKEASSLGMWVFLLTEIMFFGGMFMAYLAYRQIYPDSFAAASSKLDVTLGAMNTVVLICSSLTMAMAVHSAALGKQKMIVFYLIATLLLGGVFLGIKTKEYHDKFVHHEVPGADFHPEDWPKNVDMSHASLYFGLYFGLTGLHASHMIIGAGMLLFLIVKAHRGAYTAEWHTPVEMFGLYWHFVDIVWIFLFPLLYLIDPHFGK